MTIVSRPERKPDFISKENNFKYWKIVVDGRYCLYVDTGMTCYYIPVMDSMMMDDEPQDVHDWFKSVLPPELIMYF